MIESPAPAYGATRERGANVSHAEIERAAIQLLADGIRPSVQILRKKLGRGSPATIAESLKRIWLDMGARLQGSPMALTHLPAEVAEVAGDLWQRALLLASQVAKRDDNAARERLERIRAEIEVRGQSFALQEKEFETAARERERALADSRDHLLSTLKMLESDRAILRARDARIAALETQVESYRQQLGAFITRAVVKNRSLTQAKPRVHRKRKIKTTSKRHTGPGKRRPRSSKRRSKR